VQFPSDRKYSREHEWILVDGDEGTIGITDFAQDQLGDIVFVELPEVGRDLTKDDAFGVVESVKSVSDVFSPVNGTVIERNQMLDEHPELVNDDPYGEGWMIRVRIGSDNDLDDLLDAAAYCSEFGLGNSDG
jgi:glycine cleavage system H protein